MTLMPKRILVTGGAGFIGSAVAREIVHATPHEVVVLDKLTYAGNLDNLAPVARDSRFRFVRGRHHRHEQDARGRAQLSAGRDHAFGRREPCRPLD